MEATIPWLAAACSVLAASLMALYVRFSGPIVASQLLRQLQEDVAGMQHEWAAEKVALHRLAEEIAADCEKLETVRKRVAAAKSVIERKQAAEEEVNGDSVEAVRMRLRSQGVQI